MSRLQKAIQRSQSGEGRKLGFGVGTTEKPRAMLLGTTVRKADEAKAALEGGVDFVLVQAGKAGEAVDVVKAMDAGKTPAGAWVSELDAGGAGRDGGCARGRG